MSVNAQTGQITWAVPAAAPAVVPVTLYAIDTRGGLARKDYTIGLNTTGNGVDDPDQNFFENFSCKSERNYTGYCNPEIEKLFEAQSTETDVDKLHELGYFTANAGPISVTYGKLYDHFVENLAPSLGGLAHGGPKDGDESCS